jgi:hypothetical protein
MDGFAALKDQYLALGCRDATAVRLEQAIITIRPVVDDFVDESAKLTSR